MGRLGAKDHSSSMHVGHGYVRNCRLNWAPEVQGLKIGDRVSGEGILPAAIAEIAGRGAVIFACTYPVSALIAPARLPNTFSCRHSTPSIPDGISDDDLAAILIPSARRAYLVVQYGWRGRADYAVAGPVGIMAVRDCKHVASPCRDHTRCE